MVELIALLLATKIEHVFDNEDNGCGIIVANRSKAELEPIYMW